MKKQDQFTKKDGEQSTMADTRNSSMSNEDLTQMAAVKDKQIDLLSSMLAQKEVDVKNVKLELATGLTEKESKH